jgi:predicted MPP superfamily phosphohydrolase
LLCNLGGERIKAIKADLPSELKYIEIHTIADTHIGDVHCDMALVKNIVKEIQDNPNAYCIVNGDVINWASKNSVSDCYAEQLTPMEQIEAYSDLLEPVKQKMIAITSGNHENRVYRTEGIDLTQIVARQLGIEDKYSKESALIFVRFGIQTRESARGRKMLYTIYCNHGSGGGRKEGAKAIRLADMASIVDADIYIHSHTHLPMIMKQAYHRTNIPNSTFELVDKLFVNTGATLNYGGYGELFEFKPASKTTPIIRLNGTKKDMTARL